MSSWHLPPKVQSTGPGLVPTPSLSQAAPQSLGLAPPDPAIAVYFICSKRASRK